MVPARALIVRDCAHAALPQRSTAQTTFPASRTPTRPPSVQKISLLRRHAGYRRDVRDVMLAMPSIESEILIQPDQPTFGMTELPHKIRISHRLQQPDPTDMEC